MTKKKPAQEKTLIPLVEKLSELAVMADLGDSAGLAVLYRHLCELAEALIGTGNPAEAPANAAANMLGHVLLEESDAPEADFDSIIQTITALQKVISQQCTVEQAGFPAATLGTQIPDGTVLPPGVDEELFKAYISQQQSVLPELDDAILDFEKSPSSDSLAPVKRILHTLKGESGVIGLGTVENVCHKLEDYIEATDEVPAADVLFDTKDWLVQVIDSLAHGEQGPSDKSILSKLAAASGLEPEVPDKAEAATESTGSQEQAAELRPETYPITDRDLARDFVAEAQEHFDIADENLITLESSPDDEEAVAAVFRSFHTIKGVAGFVGLIQIGELSHVAETLFDDVRKGRRRFEGAVSDLTFASLDMLKELVQDLTVALSTDSDLTYRLDVPPLINQLTAILEGKEPEPLPTPAPQPSAPEPTADTESEGESESSETAAPAQQAQARKAPVQAAAPQQPKRPGLAGLKQTMKVDSEKIDQLLDTIGELVIAQAIVAQDPEIKGLASHRLNKNLSHLTKITRLLQDMGMGMRMVPIESTFRKMARLVRDVSKKVGKRIELQMIGKETELDKGMVEKLGDPLVHMIRNSIDHGIEPTEEEREQNGKSPVGTITLRAYHKGGSINIDITDDGRGLNRDAIVSKAIERGLITNADSMTDQQVYGLVFEPGFSTAQQVSEISGRGVGMDVVRRNIESMRGNVLINSTPGEGSTFTIVLPLTMAIIDGMTVEVGGEVYIIPTLSIVESLKPTREMLSSVTGRGEMIAFRGNLLPMFRLSRLFDVQDAKTEPCEGIIVVVEDAGRQAAVLVDKLLGQQQTVIKSLGKALGNVDGIAGASIMADGTPGLIVDVGGVVKLATD